MTSTINRTTVLMLIITCLLLLCSSNIQCLEQTPNAVTTAWTSTSTIIQSAPTDVIRLYELDHHIKKEELEQEDEGGKRDGGRPPYTQQGYKDNDDDKDRSSRKYSKHDVKQGDYDRDDDDGDKPHPTTSKTSDTIVTTIIIVATETPTPIYSGTTNNPAKQKGSSSNGGSQVNDPNSPSSSNSGNSPSGSQQNGPAETQIAQQLYKDQSAYRRLVLALSIVGSFAGVALFVGGFVYGRKRTRRKQRKQALDLEKANSAADPPSSPSSSASFPSPPPPVHHRSSSSSTSSSVTPPRHIVRFSSMSEDGDATVIDFSQNPFSDPVEAKLNNNSSRLLLQERVNMSPTAPPSLPTHSEPYADNYRQNHTLSMISQTTATALPSAPSAKELDAMTTRYENPFEEVYGKPILSGHRRQHSDVSEEEAAADNRGCIEINNIHSYHHYLSPNVSTSSSHHPQQRHMLSQTTQRSFSSSTTDLPPPPAYTPSAAPSAPPLYALPNHLHQPQQQQPSEQDSLITTSRRHSIDSIVSLNNSRPLSLRRGSGSSISYPSPP